MKHNPVTRVARFITSRKDKAYINVAVEKSSAEKYWENSWKAFSLACQMRMERFVEVNWLKHLITPRKAVKTLTLLGLIPLIFFVLSIIQSYNAKQANIRANLEEQKSLALGYIFEAGDCKKRDDICVLNELDKISDKTFNLLSDPAQTKFKELKGYAEPYEQKVNVENPILREILLRHIEMGENEKLTAGHLLEIVNIELNDQSEINSLIDPFAKLLENLQIIYLSGNQIEDISNLSNLPNLKTLYISSHQVNNIKGLSKLSNLETLRLDISSLRNLDGIKRLT